MNHQPRQKKRLRAAALVLGVGLIFVVLVTGVAFAQHSFTAGGAEAKDSVDLLKWSFRVLAAMTLLGACATIVMRNPVVCALCLVGTLFCTGGIYLMLHSSFIAAIQVLVYAGAVMVLFIFVVMSVGATEDEQLVGRGGVLSKLIGVAGVVLFIFVISPLFKGNNIPAAGPVPSSFGDVNMVGTLLFSEYLFPFEALSFLLLVSIVGAVMVSRRRRHQPAGDEPTPGQGTAAPRNLSLGKEG